MKLHLLKGVTSQILEVFIQDTRLGDGGGLTGLVYNSASLTCYYHRNTASAAVAVTLVDMTVGTFTSSGFKAVDGTNMPGVYQLCVPDAAFSTAAESVTVILKGAANMGVVTLEIQLIDVNLKDGVRAGLTALPNAAAGANGGLPLADAGGRATANITQIEGADATDTLDARIDNRLAAIRLDELLAADSDIDGAAPPTVGSVFHELLTKTPGSFTYDQTTDSLEAIRDRGDAAWTTGGGGSLTDLLNIVPLIPSSVDLANTATFRIGFQLTNGLADLPSTAEITPGTISIERKAIGGTSWSAIVTDTACSESAGMIYYDATFNSGAGYAEGDSIRITLKSQKITVSAVDYEITDTTGRMFYSEIRQTERGTNSAATAAALQIVDDFVDDLEGRLTAARAGYLDNLNVGGNVASSAEVVVIQNNTRVVRVVPDTLERPDSGSIAYRIELLLYDTQGNMEAPDSAPTIGVVNQAGTSRDANLDSTTMALVSTGRYRSTYTIDTGHALEQLIFAFSIVEGGATRVYANPGLVVDTTAVDFTAADRTKLDAIHGKLPSKTYLTGTANSDGNVQLDEATGIAVANITQISGDSAAADNAEAYFDGTGYAGTNNIIPIVTNVTNDVGITQAGADKVWGSATRTLTAISTALRNQIADNILRRSLASTLVSSDGDAKSFRSLAGAVSRLTNKSAIVGTTLTVYEPDDVTALGTQTLTTDAAANPVVSADTT